MTVDAADSGEADRQLAAAWATTVH